MIVMYACFVCTPFTTNCIMIVMYALCVLHLLLIVLYGIIRDPICIYVYMWHTYSEFTYKLSNEIKLN